MPQTGKRAAANTDATVQAKRQKKFTSPVGTRSKSLQSLETPEKNKNAEPKTPAVKAQTRKPTAKDKALATKKLDEITAAHDRKTVQLILCIRKFLKGLENQRGKGLLLHLHHHKVNAVWLRKRTKNKLRRDVFKACADCEAFMENTTRLLSSDVGRGNPIKLKDFLKAEVPKMRDTNLEAIKICACTRKAPLYHCLICGECYVGNEAFQLECGHALCVQCAGKKFTYCRSCKYYFYGWKLKRCFI